MPAEDPREESSLGTQVYRRGEKSGRKKGSIQTCLLMGLNREATIKFVAGQYGISAEEAETAYDQYMTASTKA